MKKSLALILTLCLCLGMSAGIAGASEGEVVTLRWVTVGNGMPTNYEAWLTQINPILEEKIGVNIDMEVVSWGDWDNRRSVIINTNEYYDIIFGNMNVYNTDVMINAYLPITQEMLEANAPDLLTLIPEDYWDACRVNGEIYAVPTYKDSSQSEFFVWDSSIVEALELDPASATTFETITPLLRQVQEYIGTVDDKGTAAFPLHQNGAAYILFEYDQMSTGLPAIGVRYDDAEGKVVAVLEQDDVMESLNYLHQWYEEGIINSDAATKPEGEKYTAVSIAQGWAGAAKTTWGINMGVEAEAYQWKDTIVSNETVRGSLNSISINSNHPEKALQFLNLINSDTQVRDLFYYGEEGVNWNYDENGRVHRINSDFGMAGYTQGTFFIVTPQDNTGDFNEWDEVKMLNEKAEPSVLLGFTLDTNNVNDQIMNCTEIWNRFKGEIMTGTSVPADGVAAMMAEMRAAGFEEIVAEAQTQVDAFLAK